MPATVRIAIDEAIALVTLDRPPANALDRDVFAELVVAAARLGEPDVRAVVITGTGRFFSAGLDLFRVFDHGESAITETAAGLDAAFTALFALTKPVVAAVNGHAVAGGAVIAALADFRMAADGDSRIGLTEIQVGVPFPASALEPVRFACAGPYLAEVLFRGLTYTPADARVRGLVDEVVPAESLIPRAMALAGELGAHPGAAYATMKRALRAEALARMAAAGPPGADPVWAIWRSPETRAAIARYRDRTVRKKNA